MTTGLNLEEILRGAHDVLQRLALPPMRNALRVGPTHPQRTTHYERRGWKRRGQHLYGYFRTPLGAFPGRITNAFTPLRTFFITTPPNALLTGPHRYCFRYTGHGEYSVHFHPAPTDVDTGILTVEHAILEAHQ